MPQFIATLLIVSSAMIYMFQTFGGIAGKIEAIAQKSTILTEIHNIRSGIHLAVRVGDIINTGNNTTKTTLSDLARTGYFADQINNEVSDNVCEGEPLVGEGIGNTCKNTYSAISFGGENNPGMFLSLATTHTPPRAYNPATPGIRGYMTQRPGIRVEFVGVLARNANFLENQIAADLAAVAGIDRVGTSGGAVVLAENGDTMNTHIETSANRGDGIFTIYFKDMPTKVVQQ